MEKIKILYIAGSGRSGSTLLARLLGEIDGFVNVGEASQSLFNKKRVSMGLPCGCGHSMEECTFWNKLKYSLNNDVQDFGTQVMKFRYFPLLISPLKPEIFRQKYKKLIHSQMKLIEYIVDHSGCRIIIDSSKHPITGYILSQQSDVDLYILHTIRDIRGVVSSWKKPKEYLWSQSIKDTIKWWWLNNLLSEYLRFYAKDYILVRYEDLVRNPVKTLEHIVARFFQIREPINFFQENQAVVGVHHMLGSNPDKLFSGKLVVQERTWKLSSKEYWFVSFLTLPLLIRYGYLSKRKYREMGR